MRAYELYIGVYCVIVLLCFIVYYLYIGVHRAVNSVKIRKYHSAKSEMEDYSKKPL